MKRVLSVFCLAILLFLIVGLPVHAQTGESIALPADDQEATLAAFEPDIERYDGLEIGEIQSELSGFGLFIRNIRDSISIGFTFDPVKKAEKRLQAAEWRNQVAARILESDADDKERERATQLLKAASSFMVKIESSRDKWAQVVDERVSSLVKNVATYGLRKENMLDRIESRIPEDHRDEFDMIREQAADQHRRLQRALENINIPEDIRGRLSEIKDQIEERAASREAFIDERRVLQEGVREGNPDAREALTELRKRRQEELRRRPR